MIPIRDTIPSRRTPWITGLLVAANVAVFGYELSLGAGIDPFVHQFGVVPAHWLVRSATDLFDWPGQFLTLITSQFVHGDLLHLGSNLLYLWIFGDNVEDRLGHGRFVLLYVGCGVAAAVLQIVVTPQTSIPMVGASGAIAGILGAYLLMFPAARVVTLVPVLFFIELVELPAFIFLGIWFLIQWLLGLSAIGQMANVGVAFWAHIGGFIAGMVGIVILRTRH